VAQPVGGATTTRVAPTPELTALLQVAVRRRWPWRVIPARSEAAKAARLSRQCNRKFAVLQHGLASYKPCGGRGAKRSEFPARRAEATVVDEAGGRDGSASRRLFRASRITGVGAAVEPLCRRVRTVTNKNRESGACRRWPPAKAAALPPNIASMDVHLDLVAVEGRQAGFIGTAAALTGPHRPFAGTTARPGNPAAPSTGDF